MVQNKQFKSIYGFIRLNMKTALIVWAIVIFICFLEAYFYSELDPESKKFLKERENKLKEIENERKNNNIYK